MYGEHNVAQCVQSTEVQEPFCIAQTELDPRKPLNQIPAKSVWNASPQEAGLDSITVGQALATAAEKFSDREYIVYACQEDHGDIRWTFSELNTLSDLLAASLIESGYAPGDKVAVWGPNHHQWVLLEYAIAKAGLVLVALNPLYKSQELIFALKTSQAKGLFYADVIRGESVTLLIEKIAPDAPSLKFTHTFTNDVDELIHQGASSDQALPNTVTADHVQMIQFTSGTTGLPKAAQLGHGSVTTTGLNGFRACGFGDGDRVCLGYPLFHIGGSGFGVVGSVMTGATLLPLFVFKARTTLDILEKERCTGFAGVPSMLIAMLEDETFASRDLSALRFISVGGAPVPTELIIRLEKAFKAEIANGYGQTECSGVITSIRSKDSTEKKSTTCGKALPGVSLKVVNNDGEIVDIGQPGELCYQGPGRMIGYLNDAEDNTIDEDGWLHTGDLATIQEDGYVTLVGRVKDIIIRGGENISPSEIENYLLKHPDIDEAAVFGIPDQKYGEIVCAAIRSSNAQHASVDDIKDWCRNNISLWKIPERINFVDDFPTTPSGKIKKFVLRDQLLSSLNNP